MQYDIKKFGGGIMYLIYKYSFTIDLDRRLSMNITFNDLYFSSTAVDCFKGNLTIYYALVDLGGGGGAAGACPPNRIQFFCFHIHFCRKVPTSEVGTPTTARCPPNGKSWIRPCYESTLDLGSRYNRPLYYCGYHSAQLVMCIPLLGNLRLTYLFMNLQYVIHALFAVIDVRLVQSYGIQYSLHMKLKSNIHSVSLLVIKSTQHIFSFLINVRKNCYVVVMEMAKKIVVYDGPGLLSSKLQTKRGQFLCSTFQCFVQILLTSSRPFNYFAKHLKPYLELSVHSITNLTFKCKASPSTQCNYYQHGIPRQNSGQSILYLWWLSWCRTIWKKVPRKCGSM